ncbi:hypothetical protein TGAM01_v210657 [Trichoderma gamsii]|uniref:Uncharacterized protein n=1 Tax=Trichoderma gamsii TaxID=398673 RepID=A0A2P4Z865_9HYPO|nr:hypothetical protein TGAM01_v210657 [Trichoderma gamsii]PON20487.1 hypothetical protein TGAM01_v210657 [Trichoderma gamsii]
MMLWPRGVPASTEPEESRLELRTKARGANDGAGLARCKWTAQHGTATQRQLKAATSSNKHQQPAKEATQRGKKSKRQKTRRSDHATGSGNRDAFRNSTARCRPPDWPSPPAAPAGAAPSRCSCAAETADLQPKQTLSSPAIPRCHPPKPPPKGPPRPRWCSRPRHPPITAAGRAGSPRAHCGFLGLKYGCRRLDLRARGDEEEEKGKLQNRAKARERMLALAFASGEEPRRAGAAHLLAASSPMPCCALLVPALLYDLQPAQHERVESDCRRRLNATPPQTQMRCAVLAAGR